MKPVQPLLVAFLTWTLVNATLAQAADKLTVVASTADLASVARAVGGDHVEVTALARPGEDAHFVDPKPSFIRIANQADILIEGGASLEAGWLPAILDSARNPRIALGAPGHVIAAKGVALVEVPTQLDRSMGDVHPQGNPHFILDPVAAKTVAQNIQTALCAVDGTRCPHFEAGLRSFQESIDARLAAWQAILAPMKGTKVVTYHKNFEYFLRRFGMETIDTLEPKPGIPPSPTHLAHLITTMRAEHVRLIVIEPFRERSNPDFVAQNTEARVLELPTMPDGETTADYVGLIDYNVRHLLQTFKEAQPKT